jgi:hypothetical protein
MSNWTYLNKHTARNTASHTFIWTLSQFQKHLCTIMSPDLQPCTLWHCLQTQMLLLHLRIVMDHRAVGVTRAPCKPADTLECAQYTTRHYRPPTTTATSGRLVWQAQQTCAVRRKREWACLKFPANVLERPVAAQFQGQINLWGARDNIQTGNANTRNARQKETGRRDKMTK